MELRQYIALIRKYWWLMLVTTVLAGGAAYVLSAMSPPVYRATATLEIDPASDPRGDLYQALRTGELAAGTYVQKIKAHTVLREVQSRLGLERVIADAISAEQVRDTQLIHLSAQSNDPALAQALANTTANVFIEQETNQQQARFQASLKELEGQVANLEASIAKTQSELSSLGDPDDSASDFVRLEYSRLESQLSRDQTRLVVLLTSAEEFRLAMTRYTDDITLFAPAEPPVAPVGPRTLQNTMLGLITGLMIGAGVVFLLEYLDDSVKSAADVKQQLGVDILGSLPRLGAENGTPRLIANEKPREPVSEAFRNLRTSLEFCRPDQPPRSIMITSPQPTDGKSFVAANLAVVLAQAGRSVILVDSDLRNPKQHRIFDLRRAPGFTDVFVSWAQQEQAALAPAGEGLWERLNAKPSAPANTPWALRQTDVVGLRVLTAGQPAPNPAELLASQRMRELVAWLKQEAAFVIFDTPPVLAVTDAPLLASQVDGALLVLDFGTTRLPAAAQAVERLLRVDDNLLGVVLNRVDASANGSGYYYYYNYYYDKERASRTGPLSRLSRRLGRRPAHNHNGTHRTQQEEVES